MLFATRPDAARRLAIMVVATSALTSCALAIRTEPQVLDGQERVYRDGVPTVTSRKGITLAMSPLTVARPHSDRPSFYLSVLNTSPIAIELDSTNVTAALDGRSVQIFTADEIISELRSKQAWATALTAIGGALESAGARSSASSSNVSGTYQASSVGTLNSATGTFRGSIYNPGAGIAAGAAIDAKTDARLSEIEIKGQQNLRSLAAPMLKRTTVEPRQSYGGTVVLAPVDVPERGAVLDLVVRVANEAHTFRFAMTRGAGLATGSAPVLPSVSVQPEPSHPTPDLPTVSVRSLTTAPPTAGITAPAASPLVLANQARARADEEARKTLGKDAHTVERLPEVVACNSAARAAVTTRGPGFEVYAVACANGDALIVRCEFGNCRVLK